ncbi:MAG: HEXXH motif-containing putative peptide modification protein [Alphaproteobacteria bacterium]
MTNPPVHHGFIPDPARAAAVDRRVRAAFADSMRTLLAAFGKQGVLPAERIAALEARLAAGDMATAAVAAYSDLVEAIYGDDPAAVATALEAMITAIEADPPAPVSIVTVDDGDLGPGHADRYRRLVNDDPSTQIDVRPMTRDALAAAGERLRAALALLDEGAPGFAGEVRALIRQVVLAGTGDDPALSFDGATTYMLWGSTLLNADHHPTRLALAEALVHESAHALLFGFTLGTPLVDNPTEELFKSPLRADPRPMDGIVHATYVAARIVAAMDALLASGLLSDEERIAAEASAAAHRRAFAGGVAVVDSDARLTTVGAAAFDPARSFMRTAVAG